MPLLPFDNFRIDSALTAAEVHNALAAAVEPRKRFRLSRGQCPFEGELGIDSFTLTRIINYRNSFIPRIRGRIITTSSGSTVEGTMSLHPAVLWFMSFWFGLLILFGGGIWVSMLAKGVWQPMGLVPLGMFAFGWTLTSGAFTLEARKARALLTSLLAPGQTPTLTAHTAPTPTR
ncbi:MAG: hypothetical protein H0U66_07150 [Gemmatimonadaceae bacterium]|nr:hypothetical protein [Gemmatimonadaceae bacterium]